jgi:hypothetical protein
VNAIESTQEAHGAFVTSVRHVHSLFSGILCVFVWDHSGELLAIDLEPDEG